MAINKEGIFGTRLGGWYYYREERYRPGGTIVGTSRFPISNLVWKEREVFGLVDAITGEPGEVYDSAIRIIELWPGSSSLLLFRIIIIISQLTASN